jgi:hypothetical protein
MKVKVVVAVAVDSKGNWNATGWSPSGGKPIARTAMMDLAIEGVEDGEARYFLEAEVEVPTIPILNAEVKKA